MAPKNNGDDPYMAALNVVIRRLDDIAATQQQHAKIIKWASSLAMLVIGAVAGPDAVSALAVVA